MEASAVPITVPSSLAHPNKRLYNMAVFDGCKFVYRQWNPCSAVNALTLEITKF